MRPLARGDVFVICFIMKFLIVLLQMCTQTPVHRWCWPAHSIWKRSRPSRGARASALLLFQVRFASVDHFRLHLLLDLPGGNLAEGSTKSERGQPVFRTFTQNLSRAKVRNDFHYKLD